jgi:class 3 adenylate cyclase
LRAAEREGRDLADTVIEIREPGKSPIRLGLFETLEIGRDCNGLNVADSQVSRRHVALSAVPSGLGVLDLGSMNGTFVNGELITAPTVIGRGDILRLGQTEIHVLAILDTRLPSAATETRRFVDRALGTAGASSERTISSEPPPRHAAERLTQGTRGERWTFQPHTAPDGTITTVFSDIENSSSLVERLGDRLWLELLSAHHALVRQEIARHGGFEVKSQGDGFMLAFPSALRALRCTVDIQRGTSAEVAADAACDLPIALRVRIAVHTGEVIRAADDFFGRHIVLAARLASHAGGGETLVSQLTRELVAGSDDMHFGPPRDLELRGLSGIHRAYPLLWGE